MAQLYRIIPICFKDNTLTVAMCDPQNLAVLDDLRNFLGYDVRAVVATRARHHRRRSSRYYAAATRASRSIVGEHGGRRGADGRRRWPSARKAPIDLTSVEALADSAPVRKLLNMVLLLAIKDQASDIHFEPFEDEFKMRIRPTACCTKWCRRRATWPSPSPPASRSWPTSTSPSAACRRTAASS